jgi:hypothetical protein
LLHRLATDQGILFEVCTFVLLRREPPHCDHDIDKGAQQGMIGECSKELTQGQGILLAGGCNVRMLVHAWGPQVGVHAMMHSSVSCFAGLPKLGLAILLKHGMACHCKLATHTRAFLECGMMMLVPVVFTWRMC